MRNQDKEILEYINIKKSVRNKDIQEKFSISDSSVKRSLHRLESLNQIDRYRGGANSLHRVSENASIHERFEVNEAEKEAIAKRASKMIKPNSTIILLGGTTVFRICKHIRHMKLTVVTNSLIVFNELTNCANIELILLGGMYNKDEAEVSGVLTISNSKILVCDHLFMGAAGYVRKAGFTTADMGSIELYLWCIAMSSQTNVLMDSSKFEQYGKAITAPLSDVDCLVSDGGLDQTIITEMEESEVEVYIVESEEKE